MTSPTSGKSLCAACGKITAILTCRGCTQDFCLKHASEHRQILGKKMDEVVSNYEQVTFALDEDKGNTLRRPLLTQIDEWETRSIEIIHQTAQNARVDVSNGINAHLTKIMEDLKTLSQQLKEAREYDEFAETEIRQWTHKIDKLKNEMTGTSHIIQIHQEENINSSFISKISVKLALIDAFERSTIDILIEDDQLSIQHGQSNEHGAVRGRNQFSSGQHRLRFKIDQISSAKWIFFGIVSKDVPIQRVSCSTLTSYGWAGEDHVYINGTHHPGDSKGYQTTMKIDDILEMIIDCDRRTISLTNERTRSTHQLDVDVTQCPFPWQLVLGMAYADDRVRILPSISSA